MMGGKRVYEEENMKPLIVCMCMCVSVCAAAFSLYSENEEK